MGYTKKLLIVYLKFDIPHFIWQFLERAQGTFASMSPFIEEKIFLINIYDWMSIKTNKIQAEFIYTNKREIC